MTGQRLIANRDDRSPNFDAVLAGPYRPVVRLELLVNGQLEADPILSDGDQLPISTGSVTQARSQFARQSLSVTITEAALTPTARSVLNIDGAEIRVWSGALMPDGVNELLCMGTFGIQSIAWDSPFAGLPVTGLSRGKRVMDDRFLFTRPFPAGSARYRLIQMLGESSPFSEVQFSPAVADYTIPAVSYDRDRAVACSDLALSLGAEIAETMLGDFLVQPIPDVNSAAVDIEIRPGEGGSVLTMQRSVSRDGVFNAIVAKSASTSTGTVSAVAYDNDPYSETYWAPDGSGFGRKPGFYESENLTTAEQCMFAAQAQLLNYKGTAQAVQFTGMANPAWLVSDVARLVFLDGSSEQHLLESLTIPIGAGSASGTTRAAQTGATVS